MLTSKRKLSDVARKQKENSDIAAEIVAAERARAGHIYNTILNKEARSSSGPCTWHICSSSKDQRYYEKRCQRGGNFCDYTDYDDSLNTPAINRSGNLVNIIQELQTELTEALKNARAQAVIEVTLDL